MLWFAVFAYMLEECCVCQSICFSHFFVLKQFKALSDKCYCILQYAGCSGHVCGCTWEWSQWPVWDLTLKSNQLWKISENAEFMDLVRTECAVWCVFYKLWCWLAIGSLFLFIVFLLLWGMAWYTLKWNSGKPCCICLVILFLVKLRRLLHQNRMTNGAKCCDLAHQNYDGHKLFMLFSLQFIYWSLLLFIFLQLSVL